MSSKGADPNVPSTLYAKSIMGIYFLKAGIAAESKQLQDMLLCEH